MGKKKGKDLAQETLEKLNLNFSFQYYDTAKGNKYCLSEWSKEDVKYTLSRLREMCTKPLSEIVRDRSSYHFYETDWNKTIFKGGFPSRIGQLNKLAPFHFSIIGLNSTKARVFGAQYKSTFYIAWFDYDHEILPVKLKNT
ncbi:MAG: hypothetical protein ACHQT9_02760 [Candidatus Saccharimonadales bacterium]